MIPVRHFVLAVSIAMPSVALATEPTTTRIETRPFYGATVTLEHGVRVFRPLPPHNKVIINPNGATPLSLGLSEHHSVSHNNYYSQGDGPVAAAPDGGNAYGPYGFDHRGHRMAPRHRTDFKPNTPSSAGYGPR